MMMVSWLVMKMKMIKYIYGANTLQLSVIESKKYTSLPPSLYVCPHPYLYSITQWGFNITYTLAVLIIPACYTTILGEKKIKTIQYENDLFYFFLG